MNPYVILHIQTRWLFPSLLEILQSHSKSARGNIRERLGNSSPAAHRGRGRGRGRGSNNSQKPSNRKPVTYDDLDADLDAYMAIDDVSKFDKRNSFYY